MTNPQTLALQNGTITVSTSEGNRDILHDVTVTFHRGEFVGIVGGSGSGKSTLIKSLAGINALTHGEVLLRGAPIPKERLMSDPRIAYLPQDVVIHEKLSCRRALDYIARLKNAGRTAAEREQIIDTVLNETGMTEHQHTPICRLSGGQRKRAALAAELIGDPEILLLDEVTSGLDPATDEEMMRLFRRLADRGKTVICITHAPENLRFCHRVLYVMRGNVVFSGPLRDCLRFFGARSIKEVYENQQRGTAEMWLARWRKYYGTPEAPVRGSASSFETRRCGFWQQLTVLTRRYTRLQLTDPVSCFFLFLQTALIAILVCAFGTISPEKSLGDQAGTIKGVIFTMLLSMLWCAGTSSVREIVKEQSILTHEIRFGVQTGTWLVSKLIFLFSVVVVQALAMLLIVRIGTHLPCAPIPVLFLLIFTGFSGVAVGLLVSALSNSAERAMVILPIILIAQAIFAGVLFTLSGITEFIAKTMVPAYWSLQGLTGTFSQELREAGVNADNLILGYGIGFSVAALELLLMTAVPLMATCWVLGGLRRKMGVVQTAVYSILLFIAMLAILLLGYGAAGEMGSAAVAVSETDFTYHEEEIAPLSNPLTVRVRRGTEALSHGYEAFLSGEDEGLVRAVNLLNNFERRDREVFDSDDREFVRIKEKIQTARAEAYRNVDICPKTERLRVRIERDTEALNTFYDAFTDRKDPNGIVNAYNYLKNIEYKDPSVYETKDAEFRSAAERIEKARELLREQFEKVREGILRYDTNVEDGADSLKAAKDRLEELFEQYPVLRMNDTAESLAEQIRNRYRDLAAEQLREKIEEALDKSRENELDDIETPHSEELPAEPNLDRVDTRGKTPEQIKEEKERIADRAKDEARSVLARQKEKVRRRLDDGHSEIKDSLAELTPPIDELTREYPSLKGSVLERNLRAEIAYEWDRLSTLLTLRVYEKTEIPEFLDEAESLFGEIKIPEAFEERRKGLEESYSKLNEDIHLAREKEIRRSEIFKEEYEKIESLLEDGEKVPKDGIAHLRDLVRTEEELESYFDLLERSTDAKTLSRIPEKGHSAGETVTLSIRGVDFPFAWCPAGTFEMGSPDDEPDRQDDEIRHKVTLSDGYWILRTEVTQKMYAVVMESTSPSWQSPTNQKYLKEFVYNLYKKGIPQERAVKVAKKLKFESFPVESIDRAQAVEFCDRLNELLKVKKGEGGFFFALPTEAQWEYACRAGQSGPFAVDRLKIANADDRMLISGVTIRMKDYGAADTARGAENENAWHISDMHGNVSEWCRDIYSEYTPEDISDPLVKKGGDEYVVRGGSWNVKEGQCRSAWRGHRPSGTREQQIGFRVVLTRQ